MVKCFLVTASLWFLRNWEHSLIEVIQLFFFNRQTGKYLFHFPFFIFLSLFNYYVVQTKDEILMFFCYMIALVIVELKSKFFIFFFLCNLQHIQSWIIYVGKYIVYLFKVIVIVYMYYVLWLLWLLFMLYKTKQKHINTDFV